MKSSVAIKKFCYQYGNFIAPFIFLSIHAIFITVGALIALIALHSFVLHSLFILAMMIVAAKNGASFYIDYFSKKYEQNIQALDELTKKIEELY